MFGVLRAQLGLELGDAFDQVGGGPGVVVGTLVHGSALEVV